MKKIIMLIFSLCCSYTSFANDRPEIIKKTLCQINSEYCKTKTIRPLTGGLSGAEIFSTTLESNQKLVFRFFAKHKKITTNQKEIQALQITSDAGISPKLILGQ